jgi:hypothetical protein
MTPTESLRTAPFVAWRSAVAFWSQVALTPSRVAQAQARMMLRMMQAASAKPVTVAARALPQDAPPVVAEAPAQETPQAEVEGAGVPHGALGEASALAVAAATADEVAEAPTPELAEVLPEEVAVPPQVTFVTAEEEPAVLADAAPDLVHAAVEPMLEMAGAEATPARPRRPRKG